jgi:hypothetical protein
MAPVATAALLLPGAVGAEQLQYGVSAAGNWSDNVFNQSDFSARISPYATVSDPEGDLTWSLRYQPSYEQYLDLSDVSGFDQDVRGSLAWRPTDRWTLALQQSYVSNQNSVLFNEATEPGQEVALGFEDREVRANRTSAVLSRALSPRENLVLSLGYNSLRFSEGRQSDPSSVLAAIAYDRSLSERTKAGLRLSWVQQTRDNDVAEDDTSFFYNLSATFEHSFSPTLRLVASAGPTLVDSSPPTEFTVPSYATRTLFFQGQPIALQTVDANTCNFQGVPRRAGLRNAKGCAQNGAPFSQEDARLVASLASVPITIDEQGREVDSGAVAGTDLTYFAYLALNKDWEYWKGSLSYSRSNSESANFGSSSVSDSFYATLSWKPDLRWTVSLTGGLSLQEQVGEQAVPVAFDLENVDASSVGVTSVPQLALVRNLVVSTGGNTLEYRTESVSLAANRNIGRRTSVFASVYWYTQEQIVESVTNDFTRNVDALRMSIGVRWNFDPVRF